MIGPRGSRDWFDKPHFALLYILFPLVVSILCMVLWAVLR